MGFLSRGHHMEQACSEQEPSGDGAVFPGLKSICDASPYMLCGQARTGLTRSRSPFTDMSGTLPVLLGVSGQLQQKALQNRVLL